MPSIACPPCPSQCTPAQSLTMTSLLNQEGVNDILFAAGYLTTAAIAIKFGPEIPRFLTNKILTTKSLIIKLKSWIIFPQKDHGPELRRKNLIRWLGCNLPAYCFPPTPRVYVFVKDSAVNNWVEQSAGFPPVRVLSRLEEIRDGIVFAYEGGSGTGSIERDPDIETVGTCITDDAEIEFESNIESGFADVPSYVGFAPYIGSGDCSTPNSTTIRQAHHRHENLSTVIIEENAGTKAQIQCLQSEISEMKDLFKQFVANFNGGAPGTVPTAPKPVVPLAGPSGPPPPPPPPPPPMPLLPTSGVNGIKLKTKSELTAAATENGPVKSNGPPSMYDVLKGLSSVKLKPTPRSPGGTPLRQPKSNSMSNVSDPGAFLAIALKKRFAATCSSPSPTTTDDEYNSTATGDESSFFNKENQETSINSLGRPNKNGFAKNDDKEDEEPLFGQRLLQRRLSNSLLKKKSGGLNTSLLREQN